MTHLSLHGSVLTDLIIFTICLTLCAVTSFLETSVTALRLFKIKELSTETTRYKKIIELLEKKQTQVLSTILVVKNLTDVTAATFGTSLLLRFFVHLPKAISVWLGILTITILLLVFGEIIPKILAKLKAEKHLGKTLATLNILYYTLFPVINYLIPIIDTLIRKTFKSKKLETPDTIVTSEKELQFLIDYITEKGIIESEKNSMIKSIFKLGTKSVKEIMSPEHKIKYISANSTLQEALSLFNRYQFSRLPVYVSITENVIGTIHLKDIVTVCTQHKETTIKEMIRPILFIPENTKINQLIKEFKQKHLHLALVINEYGSTTGLVSLKDIMEEIVGEIKDQYKEIPKKIITLKPHNWLIDTSVDLQELTNFLNITFKPTKAQTFNGFLNEKFQHVPQTGECLNYGEYQIKIEQATAKKTLKALITKDKPNPKQMTIDYQEPIK